MRNLYQNFTNEQMEALKKFSRIRTINDTIIKHLESHDNKNWHYNGYYDTGKFGNATCSNGHKLRYVYEAINDDGEIIQFGEKCITEFFKVTEKELKDIKRGTAETSKIINRIVEMLNDGINNSEEYKEKVKKINLNDAFDNEKDIDTVETLLSVDLPLPWWLSKNIDFVYNKKIKEEEFENKLTEEQKGILVMAELLLQSKEFNMNQWEKETFISLMNNYKDRKTLTEKQMNLLEKIVKKSCEENNYFDEEKYDETMNKLNRLMKCRMIYSEYSFIDSLINQLTRNNKLSDKQMEIIDKKMHKYRKQLENIK